MRFLSSIIACLAATSVTASTISQPANGQRNAVIPPATSNYFMGTKAADGHIVQGLAPEAQTSEALQKRAAPVVVVLGIAAAKSVAIMTKIAIEIGADTIKNLGQWNKAREEFTKKTTAEMWARNPDYRKYPAAICYNKGYHVRNSAGIAGRLKAKFSLGMLSTDYDCMYMTGNNAFYTHSDGGYINLSYTHNRRCTFDRRTGDLTCA